MKRRQFPRVRTAVPGPKSRALAGQLRAVESPNITYVSEEFPIFWREAEGCLVQDVDRNWFLDLSASFGVLTLGHCHPAVTRTLRRQAGKLVHGMGDVHPSLAKVHAAREIAKRTPVENGQVIFGLSGADAVEAALKTATMFTGRSRYVAFRGAYHGLSYGTLAVTSRDDFKAPFKRQVGRHARHAIYPRNEAEAARSLAQVEAFLKKGDVAGVIYEPIQGRGGVIVPPAGWSEGLRALCDAHGALLIADEVFTGWGRTGTWTASCPAADLYCLGKSLAGGLPLSACVAPAKVMEAWGESTGEAIHTQTFLGHPLACTVALTVINEIERLHLLERAAAIGGRLRDGLEAICAEFKVAKEARGRGLMLGLVMNSPEVGLALVNEALKQGLILLPAGDGRVVDFTPPLVISEEQIAFTLETIRRCLGAISVN